MRRTIIFITLALLTAGWVGISASDMAPASASVDTAPIDSAAQTVNVNLNTSSEGMAFTQAEPAAEAMQNPADASTVVLGGAFGNGGAWTWTDVSNLLGVYSQYGAFYTVTVNGRQYSGVPFNYLLDYAEMNTYARTLAVYDRAGSQFTFALNDLSGCADCVLAAEADGSITLVLTPLQRAIPNLMRIEAASSNQAAPDALPPTDSQTIALNGQFNNGGYWTWADIENLLGVYGQYGQFAAVTFRGQEYVGVPVSYLMTYAGLTNQATRVFVTDRDGGQVPLSAQRLSQCSECLLIHNADNTLSLFLPDPVEPVLVNGLLTIEAF